MNYIDVNVFVCRFTDDPEYEGKAYTITCPIARREGFYFSFKLTC